MFRSASTVRACKHGATRRSPVRQQSRESRPPLIDTMFGRSSYAACFFGKGRTLKMLNQPAPHASDDEEITDDLADRLEIEMVYQTRLLFEKSQCLFIEQNFGVIALFFQKSVTINCATAQNLI